MADQPLEDLLARLDRERRDADRRYNDALTAVDRAIQAPPRVPPPPRRDDDTQTAAMGRGWNILPDGAPRIDRSLKGRLRAFIWQLVGPPLDTQKQFNAAIVDYANRTLAVQRETHQALSSLLEVVRHEFEALSAFESLLVQYLQTITAYIDTKVRSAGSGEIRDRLSLLEQRVLAVNREIESKGQAVDPASAARSVDGRDSPFTGSMGSASYVGFEDRFRGSRETIRARVDDYLPLLRDASDVLDVGCGRGELLDLLKQNGVRARGVDTNRAMVDLCRARGLDVAESDALSYLDRQPDGRIGGLVAIQVVEHFEPAYLVRFLDAAHQKLRAGAPLVLETINPACWMAFFETFIRDPTHERPLHPETLKYLVQAAGFASVDIQYRMPVGEGDRLERVAAPTDAASAGLASVAAAVNAHADKLNARLFSSMDYAVIARR